VTVQYNTATGGGVVAAVQHGNMTVYQREPPYRLALFNPVAPPLPQHSLTQPSRMLAAANRVVEFYGRREELEQLAAWRDGLATFDVQLWHGRGGQGKTRLATRFAELSGRLGWAVVEAHHGVAGSAYAPMALEHIVKGRKGVVVLVDYADRWPPSALQSLVFSDDVHAGMIRLLLLARSPGSWWNSIRSRLDGHLGVDAVSRQLGPLTRTPSEKAELFRLATWCFAEVLGVEDADGIEAPGELSQAGQGQALSVQMAALAAVYAHRYGQSAPRDPAALSAFLLRREIEYWQLMHHQTGQATRAEQLARVAYVAALTRALPYETAVDLMVKLSVTGLSDAADQVITDHKVCYPPSDPELVLEPIYPDRLGEDFVALQTPGHDQDDHQADQWATAIPAKLVGLAGSDTVLEAALPKVLMALIETSIRWPHVARRQLYPLLRTHPHLVVRAGGAVLSTLTRLELDRSVVDALESHFPLGSDPDLDAAMADLTTRLAERMSKSGASPEERMPVNRKLGMRLANAGRFEEALPPLREAVDLLTGLATAETGTDATHRLRLADCLGALAEVHFGLGDNERALAAADEALDIWAELRELGVAVPEETVAKRGTLLADVLSRVDRVDEALDEQNVVTTILRRLVSNNAVHHAALAESYDTAARYLFRLGRLSASEEMIHNAISVWRKLAETSFTRFRVRLAAALSRLSTTYPRPRTRAERVKAAAEAVELYRELARADVGYLPHLARVLANLADLKTAEGYRHEALDHLDEAIAVSNRLASTAPASGRHSSDRLRILRDFARVALDSGQRLEEALTHIYSAIELLRERAQPEQSQAELEHVWELGADLFNALGRPDTARAIRERIVRYRRPGDPVPHAQPRAETVTTIRIAPVARATGKRPWCDWCHGDGVVPPGSYGPWQLNTELCARCH